MGRLFCSRGGCSSVIVGSGLPSRTLVDRNIDHTRFAAPLGVKETPFCGEAQDRKQSQFAHVGPHGADETCQLNPGSNTSNNRVGAAR